MAASIGGKYRPASPSFARLLVTCMFFAAAQGLQQGVLHYRRQPHLAPAAGDAAPTLCSSLPTTCSRLPPQASCLDFGGNIHLFRQRWWKSTFIPALLTPPPHGGSLPLAHIKLGELLVDRGMLVAQQVCTCVYTPPCMLVTVTIAQWDDFLVRVRQLSQDHKQLPVAAPAAGAAGACVVWRLAPWRAAVLLVDIEVRVARSCIEMQVTRVMLRRLSLRPALLNIRRLSKRHAATYAGSQRAGLRVHSRSVRCRRCARGHEGCGGAAAASDGTPLLVTTPASCICAVRQRLSRIYFLMCWELCICSQSTRWPTCPFEQGRQCGALSFSPVSSLNTSFRRGCCRCSPVFANQFPGRRCSPARSTAGCPPSCEVASAQSAFFSLDCNIFFILAFHASSSLHVRSPEDVYSLVSHQNGSPSTECALQPSSAHSSEDPMLWGRAGARPRCPLVLQWPALGCCGAAACASARDDFSREICVAHV